MNLYIKIIILITVLLLGGLAWWYMGYSEDKSECERRVIFRGSTQDGYFCLGGRRGAGSEGTCSTGAYESRSQAVDACMKYYR